MLTLQYRICVKMNAFTSRSFDVCNVSQNKTLFIHYELSLGSNVLNELQNLIIIY